MPLAPAVTRLDGNGSILQSLALALKRRDANLRSQAVSQGQRRLVQEGIERRDNEAHRAGSVVPTSVRHAGVATQEGSVAPGGEGCGLAAHSLV